MVITDRNRSYAELSDSGWTLKIEMTASTDWGKMDHSNIMCMQQLGVFFSLSFPLLPLNMHALQINFVWELERISQEKWYLTLNLILKND